MTLTVRVVALEDASKLTNKKARVTLRVLEADQMFSEFTIPVESIDGWNLGDMHDLTVAGVYAEVGK